MTLIPILGLIAILVTAWLVSWNRRAVRLRPIAFGLVLQFLLSIAVLRADAWSFLGMGVLAIWIALFCLRLELGRAELLERVLMGLGLVIGSVVLYSLPLVVASTTLFLIAAVLAADRRYWIGRPLRSWLAATLPLLATISVAQRGIYGLDLLELVGGRIAGFLELADYGSRFLFGNLADSSYYFPESTVWPGFGFLFAFKLLPVIVFFAAVVSVLYSLGVVQLSIESLSRFLRWSSGTSGAETLCCTANIFIGQTEAPLLIRPYLASATRSELLTVMVAGFATIAGGALAGYIALGIPASHLVAASVMSAPAALVIAKILLPETEHPTTAGDTRLPDVDVPSNLIEAATNGIRDGLRLAVNVGAMLIGFISLMALVDTLLSLGDRWLDGAVLAGRYLEYGEVGFSPVRGEFAGYFPGSLRTVFGTLLRPISWLLGVPWSEAATFGNLLGIKLSLNEFVAYGTLAAHIQDGSLSDRSIQLAAYALCGFANFSSIGMQIGGLSALVPERRRELARFGLRAMLGGALASWMTAAIAALQL